MSLGEAFVTAQADTDGFLPDLKGKLDAILKNYAVEVKVQADLSRFREDIASATRDRAVEVTVEADLTRLREQLESATRDRAVTIRARIVGLDESGSAITVPVYGDTTFVERQINTLQGATKATPILLYFRGLFTQIEDRIAALELEDIDVPLRPANLRGFRKLVNDGLALLAPANIKLQTNVSVFLAKLQRELNSKDIDPIDVRLTASTAALRTLIQQQFNRERFRLRFDADTDDLGDAGTEGFLEMSAAADRATASIRRQLRALLAAGASESEALGLLRREIDALAARARALNIDIPVDIDTTKLAAALERAVERAQATKNGVEVPITADLTLLRAQLANLGTAEAIEVPVRADLTVFRAQIAAFTSLNPVSVAVRATNASLQEFRAQLAAYTRANPVEIEIQARLEQGNLKELRTQAGRLAAVRVRATIDNNQFRAALIAAGAQDVPIKITPVGSLKKFRDEIVAYFRADPAEIAISPANMKQFRDQIRIATEGTNVPVNIRVGNIDTFLATIRAAIGRLASLEVNLTIGNRAIFRAEIESILQGRSFPVNIRPVITSSDQNRLRETAGRAGDSAGKTLGERLNKAFSFAFGSLGRNFRQLERALLAVAVGGEAAFVGLGVAGLKLGADLELLNISLENLADSTEDTERPLLTAGQNIEALQKKILEFAQNSPLGVEAVTDSVIRLTSSLGVSGNQALAQIDAITSALAISPGSLNAEGLAGVTKALTQIAAAGKLGGQELLQLSNQIPTLARVEIFTNLAKQIQGTALAAKSGLGDVSDATDRLTAKQLAAVKKLQKAGEFDSNEALSAIFEALSNTPGAEKALEKFTDSFTGTMQRIKETLQNQFAGIFLDILKPIADGLDEFSKTVVPALEKSGIVEAFKTQFDSVIKILGAALPGILKLIVSIGEAFTGIFDKIGPQGFADIFTGAEAVMGVVLDGIGLILDGIGSIVGAFRSFREFLNSTNSQTPFLSSTREILASLATTFQLLIPIAQNALGGLRDGFTVLAPIIVPVAVALSNIVEIIARILASDFGRFLFALAATIALVTIALRGMQAALVAATVQSLTFGGAITAATGRLAAMAAAAGITSVATAGIAGVVAAVALAAGFGLGKLLIHFGLLGDGAEKAAASTSVMSAETEVLYRKAVALAGAMGQTTASVSNLTQTVSIFKNVAGNIEITVKDNFGNVTQRLVGLNASLAKFRAANADLLNFDLKQLELAQLRSQQEDAEGKVIGPILPGTTRKDFVEPLPDFGVLPDPAGLESVADATKAAGESAKKAAEDSFKTFRQTVKDQLDELFKTLTTGDAGAIKDKLIDLAQQITKGFEAAGKPIPKGLLNSIKEASSELQGLARQLDKVNKLLDDAKSKFDSVKDAAIGFASITGAMDDVKKAAEEAARAAEEAANKSADGTKKAFETLKLDVAGSVQIVRNGFDNLSSATTNGFNQVTSATAQGIAALRAAQAKGTFDPRSTNSPRALPGTAGVDVDVIAAATKEAFERAQRVARSKGRELYDDLKAVGKNLNTALIPPSGQAASIASALQARLKLLQTFAANVEALRKKGLNKTTLDQIIAAGVEGGGETAAALASQTEGQLDAIDKLQADIEKAAKKVGETAIVNLFGDQAKALGANIVDGLIVGLKDRKGDLQDAMTEIAKTLVTAIKKALGIKSPARAMIPVGKMSLAGVGVGFDKAAPGLMRSAQNAVSGLSSLKVPSLGDISSAGFEDAKSRLGQLNLPEFKTDINAIQNQRLALDSGSGMSERTGRALLAEMSNNTEATRGAPRATYHQPVTVHANGPAAAVAAAFSSHGVAR